MEDRFPEIAAEACHCSSGGCPKRLQGATKRASQTEFVRRAYQAFRERVAEVMVLHRHDCEACRIFPTLELKFVVHHGPLVVQQIVGRERLLGPAVNLTHRLLENSITEQTGRRAYLFITEPAERLSLSPEIGTPHEERYADVGAITGIVMELDAARVPQG